MKLSSLLLLSLGNVNAQEENTDLSQLQALLKLPGAQELLASLNKEKEADAPASTPVEAPVETPSEVPVESPAAEPVDSQVETPIEAPVEAPIEAAAADVVADVDTDDSVHVVPGQMAAAEEGEKVITNPVLDTTFTLPPGVVPLNQTTQLNATVTPELVTVTIANQTELANVTVTTASVANVTTTISSSNVVDELNPLQPVEQLDERLEDEDEPESAPPTEAPIAEVPVASEASPIVEQPVEAAEEIESEPAAAETATSETDASAVFNNLSAEEQAALLAKLQAATQPDIDLKMSNTDMILGQIDAGMASLATEPSINATQVAVNVTEASPTEPSVAEDVTQELGAYGSRAEEEAPVDDTPMMMTGANPEVYGGEPEEPEVEEPVSTEDSAIEDMETQMEESLNEFDALDDLSDNTEDDDEYYDSYEDDDDWEDDYDDDEDEWDEWDEDGDGLDIYEIDQDDELDEEPRNHYDAAYREKALEDYESILEQQEEAFETEQEAEAAQYNFAFFMILFITVFTGGYYAYGKIREKFFPASSSQQYTPLPKEDGDVKQSVSSETKADEDWDNENW